MSQYAVSQNLMCCTEVNAEDPLEYQSFFTADVYSCVRCKFVLPSHALHTNSMMQLMSGCIQLRASSDGTMHQWVFVPLQTFV